MYAILDGKAEFGSTTLSAAYFYTHGGSETLFTYQLTNPQNDDIWGFSVRQWDTPKASISREMYPTLQHVTYDYRGGTLGGNCTVSSNSTQSSDMPCLHGSFDVGNPLSLNITSTVSLDDTPSGFVAPSVTSLLRSQDRRWYLKGNDAPAAILRLVDPASGRLQDEILRTTVKKISDCAQIKVCLKGTGREGPGVLVGAEMLAPLGLILKRQGDFATNAKCAGE